MSKGSWKTQKWNIDPEKEMFFIIKCSKGHFYMEGKMPTPPPGVIRPLRHLTAQAAINNK